MKVLVQTLLPSSYDVCGMLGTSLELLLCNQEKAVAQHANFEQINPYFWRDKSEGIYLDIGNSLPSFE